MATSVQHGKRLAEAEARLADKEARCADLTTTNDRLREQHDLARELVRDTSSASVGLADYC
ncbi:hypothetical protein T484DRAFT_1807663 [Baffinella frigidus]|nr:hypothetical protein T484DRAFT_1807663 [Cryptophyta sp. CCMP2293]